MVLRCMAGLKAVAEVVLDGTEAKGFKSPAESPTEPPRRGKCGDRAAPVGGAIG